MNDSVLIRQLQGSVAELNTTAVTQADLDAGLASKVEESLLDAKGDMFAASANDTPGRLAVGSNDQVLTADSTQPLGVKWATPSGGSGGTSFVSQAKWAVD